MKSLLGPFITSPCLKLGGKGEKSKGLTICGPLMPPQLIPSFFLPHTPRLSRYSVSIRQFKCPQCVQYTGGLEFINEQKQRKDGPHHLGNGSSSELKRKKIN